MPIQERQCKTWSEFKATALPSLFSDGVAARGRYYFRGQGSSLWPLMSSFDRWYRSSNKKNLSKKEAAERFLLLFRDEASRLTPDPGITSNPEQLLGLAQHYGIPTRLLDWTETPYVAAFFAFSGIASSPDSEHRIAIWCLDITSRIWDEDTGIKLLSIPSPYNERLKNQLGKFTLLQSPFDSVEEHIDKCDATGTALQKITLPASEARTALSDLDFMGINYSTIYPGLTGCARAASLRMLLEQ
jgi:FRG domain-containing protein